MHILILADAIDNQNAGIHFYTKYLIENLLKIDQKNKYSFIHAKENTFFKKNRYINDQNNHIIPQKKYFGAESIRRLVKIPRLIKKINPDIVLEPCHIGLFNLPKHIKKVVTIHDLTPILFPEFHIRRSTIIHKLLLKKVLQISDLILTVSENSKNDIQKLYNPRGKIIITPLGIEKNSAFPLSSAKPNTDSSPKQKQHSSLIPGTPYILFLGTLEPRKNLSLLIDAFLELKQKQKTKNQKNEKFPHKLVLAGDIGWKSKKLLKKANHPEIIITGYVNESQKSALLKNADLFVYPSLYEGFGLPPLEAMSYGVPVITSTGGSLKELFANQTLTHHPTDKTALKSHILKIISNPELKSRLIKNGLEYSQNFTWETTARLTLQAFEKLIS